MKSFYAYFLQPRWLPFLVAIFPVLLLYSHNREEVVVSSTFLAFGMAFLFAGVLLFVSWIVFGNKEKAALISSLAVFLFFSYSDFFYIDGGAGLWIRHRYLIGLYAAVLIANSFLLFYVKWDLSRLVRGFMLSIFVVLLSLATPLGVFKVQQYRAQAGSLVKDSTFIVGTVAEKPEVTFPDIYYIAPDGYPGVWSFENEFGYDNSTFEKYLQNHGFYVNAASISNYNSTTYTLNALMNANYMEELVPTGILSAETVSERSLIRNHAVGRYVKNKGYTYIHVGDRYEWNYENSDADININTPLIPEFFFEVWKKTLFHPLRFKFVLFDIERRRQAERILFQFEELAKIPFMEGPTFTFAHLSVPHRPYVFREDGSFVTATEESARASSRKDYQRQITFVNKKLAELVDGILANSKEPPIIIIQSDHGSRLYNTAHFKTEADLTDTIIIDRLNNFSAFYLPGVGHTSQLKYLTQVNVFRFLFNTYFGENFELLPDRNYLLAPWNEYELIDRTEFMREALKKYEGDDIL